MCDAVFAVGQRGGYLFETPSRRSKGHLPQELEKLFTSSRVASVHSLTLGVGNSFFISYRDVDDQDSISSSGLPEALRAFLHEKDSTGECVRDFPNLQVSLGPYNKSWWAQDGKRYRWNNLPAGLEAELETLRRPAGGGWTGAPRLLVLGADSNYLLLTQDDRAAWNLTSYRELEGVLNLAREDDDFAFVAMIHSVYLCPYRLRCSVLQSRNGATLATNLPPHAQSAWDSIAQALEEDTSAVVRQERDFADQLESLRLQQQQQQRREYTAAMLAMMASLGFGRQFTGF